jgi:hypothetical protein
LFIDNAFPDAANAIKVIQDSLLDAAEKYKPGASAIHRRLETDHEYMSMMVRLVSEGLFIHHLMLLTLFVAATSTSTDSK